MELWNIAIGQVHSKLELNIEQCIRKDSTHEKLEEIARVLTGGNSVKHVAAIVRKHVSSIYAAAIPMIAEVQNDESISRNLAKFIDPVVEILCGKKLSDSKKKNLAAKVLLEIIAR